MAPAIGGPVSPPQAQMAIVNPIIDPRFFGSGVTIVMMAACKDTILPMKRPWTIVTTMTPAAVCVDAQTNRETAQSKPLIITTLNCVMFSQHGLVIK